jgi:hypothetical protein
MMVPLVVVASAALGPAVRRPAGRLLSATAAMTGTLEETLGGEEAHLLPSRTTSTPWSKAG